jgi:hypothetical protein
MGGHRDTAPARLARPGCDCQARAILSARGQGILSGGPAALPAIGNPKAATHSITWSARARSGSGIVRPSAFAVFRLMTSSNFVGCWTGRSAGLAPLRIFPA